MKRIIVVLLAVILLTSCAAPEKHSSLEAAKQILVETKEKTAETVKPECFESDEWKAFVDGYWNGYNKGHEPTEDELVLIADGVIKDRKFWGVVYND